MFRFLHGPALIAAVIATFEKLLSHLERGISHTHTAIVQKTSDIVRMEEEVAALSAHAERGERFAAKIRAFLE